MVFIEMRKNKSPKITWIIEGSLNQILHRNARLKPAKELVKNGWEVIIVTSGFREKKNDNTITTTKTTFYNNNNNQQEKK